MQILVLDDFLVRRVLSLDTLFRRCRIVTCVLPLFWSTVVEHSHLGTLSPRGYFVFMIDFAPAVGIT